MSQFWVKTFKCSGENLPNSSCYFPNHKSFFLQILHHSLVSWKITLYFFQIKHCILFMEGTYQNVNFWDFWVLGSKFTKFLSVLKQQIGFSSNFASTFSVMRLNSSVLFQLKIYILSTKGAYQGTNLAKSKVWNLALWWVLSSK